MTCVFPWVMYMNFAQKCTYGKHDEKSFFPYQLLFRLLKSKSWYDHVELPYSIYHLSQLLIVTFTFNLILSCDIFLFLFILVRPLIFKDRNISLYKEKCKINIWNGNKITTINWTSYDIWFLKKGNLMLQVKKLMAC